LTLRVIKDTYTIQSELFRDSISRSFAGNSPTGDVIITQYDPKFTGSGTVNALITVGNRWLNASGDYGPRLIDFHYDGQSFYAIYSVQKPCRPLVTVLRDSPSISMQMLDQWTKELLDQLCILESLGVYHGGISLHSIVIDGEGKLSTIHAGLHAEIVRLNLSEIRQIESAIFLTESQLNGHPSVIQDDIHAVGVLTYLFFSNTWPYEFTGELARARALIGVRHRPFSPSNELIPSNYPMIIDCALMSKSGDGYPSMQELRSAFLPTKAPQPTPNSPIIDPISTEIARGRDSDERQPLDSRILDVFHRKKRIITTVIIGLVLAFTTNYLYVSYVTSIPEITVPNIQGESLTSGISQLEAVHLQGKVAAYRPDYTVPEGTILETRPPGGRQVKQNRIILLTVSKYTSELKMPDLIGRTITDAQQLLPNPKTKIKIIGDAFSMSATAGEIMSQIPTPGVTINANSAVQVTISKGFPVQIDIHPGGKKYIATIIIGVPPDWPEQEIRVTVKHGGTSQQLLSKTVSPGDTTQTSAPLDLSDTLSVSYNGKSAISQSVKDLLAEEAE